MFQNKKIIAIIPARGGSKSIPRKNIKLLDGKPLIAYSIEQAKQCDFIDRIIVSTDDEEIAEISRRYGAEIQMRPKELAQDDSPTIKVLQYVVRTLEKENYFPDMVVLLQPTNPFRKIEHINKAIEKIIQGFDSATTISPLEINPSGILEVDANGKCIFDSKDEDTLRQKINKYRIFGNVYTYNKDALMKILNLSWEKNNNAAIKISREESFEIDGPLDFEIAEYLMQKLRKNE